MNDENIASVAASSSQYQPSNAMDYSQWYQQNAANPFDRAFDPNSFFGKIVNFFTGTDKTQRERYNTYLDNLKQSNEWKATQSANVYDETMSSSAYQRAFKDLEAAGINPYLLLNSGSVTPASSGSGAKASYSDRKSIDVGNSSNDMRNIALLLLATARLVGSGAASSKMPDKITFKR